MSNLKSAMQHIAYPRKTTFDPTAAKSAGDQACSLDTKPGARSASRLSFVDDFLLEHSAPSADITSIEISGTF